MPRVLLQDLVALSRLLLATPAAARAGLAADTVERARSAAIWRQRTRTAHPIWGDGTIEAACQGRKPDRDADVSDPEFRTCLMIALLAIDAGPPASQSVTPSTTPGTGQAGGQRRVM